MILANGTYSALDISNTSQTITSLTGTSSNFGNPSFVNLGSSGSLTLTNASGTFGGNLVGSGTAQLIISGGTETFSGSQPFDYTGSISVTSATLLMGANGALPFGAALNVGPSGILNINGSSGKNTTVIGSLTGSGVVTNSTTTGSTIVIGYDNTSTTFSGQFTASTPADLSITKIGTGILSLTGNSSSRHRDK